MVITPTTPLQKLSKVEGIKERSNYLREPVATELLQDTTCFTEESIQILKFHGSYQQDDRDRRIKGQEKDYQFMLRTCSPGGFIPPVLYLTLDRLATEYGNGTLRATTRQGFQLHGILKKNLKAAIAAIVKNMGSTLSACGDVNRNVMAPPAPYKNRPEYNYAWKYANNIADLLRPQTGAYYEIWLDGEKAISAEEDPAVVAARQPHSQAEPWERGNGVQPWERGNGTIVPDSEEPLYGDRYMPRKFKCAVTVPGDNSVDLYSQDISLVVITNEQGELEGFNVFAGGGLGRTHNKEETFPRLADPIGYVNSDDVYDLIKAILATQRDYGDRTNRRHARMKYLLEDWGVDKFRDTVVEYFGKEIAPFKPLPPFKYDDFLGWHEQGDGKLFLGISIENGRIKDEGEFKLRTALREIVQQFDLPMRLTPHQNLILYDIDPAVRSTIEEILSRCGVQADPNAIDALVRYSMACPALPTCGLAITESERVMPGILQRIRAQLNKLGMEQEHFVVRMTGCPNGCARPYMAELGFVGIVPSFYEVWLGGSPDQTRLAQVYVNKLHVNDLESFLEPIFIYFKQQRQASESFGDFCSRVGNDAISEFAATYEPATPAEPADIEAPEVATPSENDPEVATSEDTDSVRKSRPRISVKPDVYDRLKEASAVTGKPMIQLATEALEAYLNPILDAESP